MTLKLNLAYFINILFVVVGVFFVAQAFAQEDCSSLTCNNNVLIEDAQIAAEISEIANDTVYKVEYIIFRRPNPEPSDENLIANPIQWHNRVYFKIDYEETTPLVLLTDDISIIDHTTSLLKFSKHTTKQMLSQVIAKLSEKRNNYIPSHNNSYQRTHYIARQIPLLHDSAPAQQEAKQSDWEKLEYLGLGLIPKILNTPTRKISISFVSTPIWSGNIPTEIIAATRTSIKQQTGEVAAADSYSQRINPFNFEDSLQQLTEEASPISAQAATNQSYTQSNTNVDVSNILSLLLNTNETQAEIITNITAVTDFFTKVELSDDFKDMHSRLKLSSEYEVLDATSWLQPALPKQYSVGSAFTYDTESNHLLSGVVALLRDRFLHLYVDFSEFEKIPNHFINSSNLNQSNHDDEQFGARFNPEQKNSSNLAYSNANQLVLAQRPTLFRRVKHWGNYFKQMEPKPELLQEYNLNNSLSQTNGNLTTPVLNLKLSSQLLAEYYFNHAESIYNPDTLVAATYSYQSNRKIELEEIHYFDHPNLGILIRVIKIGEQSPDLTVSVNGANQ